MNVLDLTEQDKKKLLRDLITSKDLRDTLDDLYSDPGIVSQTISIYHLILLAEEEIEFDKK